MGKKELSDTLTANLFEDEDVAVASGGHAPPGSGGDGTDNEDDGLPLGDYAEQAYLAYAMSVLKGRAIPDLADGQKPVQRRILYAMMEMGLTRNAKPVKSARVVGDVLGKFHPHGDASAYEAMVRMAQDFSLRYPLVDGHGNFGSRDGDNAAAMRYTEARLTTIAELLLSEIKQGTVDFIPNYDGTLKEPKLLPARLPMLLLNGASGIAVGMATEIPPHNLREVADAAVALIKKPSLSVRELMEYVKGPDFPGGGQIISPAQDLLQVYETGRGAVRCRARWNVEDKPRGKWQIVVYELPPQTSAQKILQEVDELTNPKVRLGKKSLSAEQIGLKQTVLSLLGAVRDESSRESAVRLVFEPASSRIDEDKLMQVLLSNTSLEGNAPANFVCLGLDGRPQQKNLKAILSEWIDYRFVTVTRRTQFRLEQVQARIHILDGRMIAFLNIDKVIRIIRKSDDPKPDLMKTFDLSEIQAEDILEIRLRQLARLEGIKIEQEIKDLKAERKELKNILEDKSALKRLVVKEITNDAKTYGDDRRTRIKEASFSRQTVSIPDEPITVVLSKKGWVRSRSGHEVDLSALSYKEGDAYLDSIQTRTSAPVFFLDTTGRAYTLRGSDIPGGRGEGVPVASLIEMPPGAKVAHMLGGDVEQRILVAGSGGYGFITQVKELLSRVKAGKAFLSLDIDETPIKPIVISNDTTRIATLSEKGKFLIFGIDEVREVARGKGVMLMGLDGDDKLLAAVALSNKTDLTVHGVNRSGKPVSQVISWKELESFVLHRARKGKLIGVKWKVISIHT